MKQPIKFLFICCLLIFPLCHAARDDLGQTKSQLKELENKINRLQNELSQTKDKKAILNRELANTDKQISHSIKQLHTIHLDLTHNQQKIEALNKEIEVLSQQLSTEQQLLANHIRLRYKVGEYQPLKWLLNQENPYAISQLLTYYNYLIKSHLNTITKVDTLKTTLDKNQTALTQEFTKQKRLEDIAVKHQERLQSDKKYQTRLINKINADINNTQTSLVEYQNNKKNLTRLLKTLAKENGFKRNVPFSRLRHKLPLPVTTAKSNIEAINQGIMLFAEEGLPVKAVYPGAVVFSDWLKGYGLLLIIDHGQGYLSLYAHNQSLFKQKGDPVDQGEQIATIGHSGGIKKNGLYFEIRHRGKAISPLNWLS